MKSATRFICILSVLTLLLSMLPITVLASEPCVDGIHTIFYYGEEGFKASPAECREPLDCETVFDSGDWYCYAYYQGNCTHSSFWKYRCKNCGREKNGVSKIDSTNFELLETERHDWEVSRVPVIPATCAQNAYSVCVCTNCNKYLMASGSASDYYYNIEGYCAYTEIPGTAKGHEYDIYDTVTATCTTPGRTCIKCNVRESALGHDFSTQATCTAPSGVCTRKGCGYSQPAKGHTWLSAICTAPKKCLVCSATEGAALGHSITTPATCDRDSSPCSRCGSIQRAPGHKWSIQPKIGLKGIPCTNPGCTSKTDGSLLCLDNIIYTLTPGESFDLQLKSSAASGIAVKWAMTSHSALPGGMTMELSPDGKLTGVVPAETGLLETSSCTATLTLSLRDSLTQEELKYYAGDTTVEICLYLGGHTYQLGADSNNHYTYYFDTKTGQNVIVPGTTRAHRWAQTYTSPATCTTAGFNRYDCTVCNKYKEVPVSALGHDYSVPYHNTAIHGYECSRCGALDYEDTENHDKNIVVHTLAASNTEDGFDTLCCSVCGAETGTSVVKAVNHIHTAYGWSCDWGTKKHYMVCVGCNETFTEPQDHTVSAANTESGKYRAQGEENGFTWTLDDTGTLTIMGEGNTLPDSFCVGDFNTPGAWYEYVNDIKSLVIQGKIDVLKKCGFKECTNLTSVNISGVKELEGKIFDSVFIDCKSIQTVIIGPGVQIIGKCTFYSCSNLQTVSLGPDVTVVSDSAFAICNKLQSIQFASGDVTIKKNGLGFCSNNFTTDLIITIPSGNTIIEEDAFYHSSAEIYFFGDMPELKGELNTHTKGEIICYYPCNNTTWDIPRFPRTAEWRKQHKYSNGIPTEDNGTYYLDYICEICEEPGRDTIDFVTCTGAAFSITCSGTPQNYTVYTEDGTIVNELGTTSTGVWINDELLKGKTSYNFSIDGQGCHKLFFQIENSAAKSFLVYLREHVWDDGKIQTKPTCKDEGVTLFTCDLCKSTRTEPIPKTTEHTWDRGVQTIPATAEREGEITYTCTTCGTTRKETTPRIHVHTWDEGIVVKEIKNINIPGRGYVYYEQTIRYTCIVCGETTTSIQSSEGPEISHEHTFTPGDVDNDKRITSADARLALRKAVGLETYDDNTREYVACDVDNDGRVTSADARLILRAAVGLEDVEMWIAVYFQ